MFKLFFFSFAMGRKYIFVMISDFIVYQSAYRITKICIIKMWLTINVLTLFSFLFKKKRRSLQGAAMFNTILTTNSSLEVA